MPVTIKMIAKEMGLAVGTVSQGLRNDPRIAGETKRRVVQTAQEMGYVLSDFGRALKSGKSNIIGYFLIDITKSFYADIMKGIAREATSNNYGVLFAAPLQEYANEIAQIKYFEQKRVEGIIISGCEPETWEYLERLNKNGIPVIVCGDYTKKSNIEEVATDDFMGGQIAAEHFINLGHRKMAYYNPEKNFNYRLNGFIDTVVNKKLPSPAVCDSRDVLKKLLCQADRPTAIFAYKDLDALEVIEIANSIGLKVPEELSVIGYDDDVYSSFKSINLTTLRQQKNEIGKLSVANLLKKINGEKIKTTLLKPELIIRGSTSRKGG